MEKRLRRFAPCFFCCISNLFVAVENFLKYFNRNIYIMTAVHGTDFCTSGKLAFNMLTRNIANVIVLTKVQLHESYLNKFSSIIFFYRSQACYFPWWISSSLLVQLLAFSLTLIPKIQTWILVIWLGTSLDSRLPFIWFHHYSLASTESQLTQFSCVLVKFELKTVDFIIDYEFYSWRYWSEWRQKTMLHVRQFEKTAG